MTASTPPPALASEALLIVDSRVGIPEQWLAAITAQMPVFILDAAQDGLAQLAAIVAANAGAKQVHLVSHGSPGALLLGNAQVNEATLTQNAALLEGIGPNLASGAELLLYGCNVAADEAGRAFIASLAQLTGAQVAASNDATGNGTGADWELEAGSGNVTTAALSIAGLQGLLASAVLTDGSDTPVLSAGDDTITADSVNSLQAGDVIDGGDGSDTLEISADQTVTFGATTLTNVETLVINAGVQDITTHDATVGAGQTLTVDASASSAALRWSGQAETDGSFLITGGSDRDTISGGAGNDLAYGGANDDVVSGDAGADLIKGDAGNDLLYGGDGNDTLWGGDGTDALYGDDGSDTYAGVAAELAGDTIHDFSEDDSIVVWSTDLSALDGTAAAGTIDLGGGSLTLNGITKDSGSFAASYDGNKTTITLVLPPRLTAGSDSYLLGGSDDTIFVSEASSLNANDTIDGGGGNDTLEISADQTVDFDATTLTNVEFITITAGAQDISTHDATVGAGQTLTVDASTSSAVLLWHGIAETDGSFLVKAGSGADSLWGGDGNDTLYGGGAADTIYAGAGSNILYGGDGNDFMHTQLGGSLLYGDAGNDTLAGGNNDDTLDGGTGDDVLAAGTGADLVSGGDGNDRLLGNADNDTLYGGEGNDTLSGDTGADLLYGEAGNDVFQGTAANLAGDTIADFGAGDSIVVSGVDLSGLNGTDAAGTIDLGGGQSLTLTGITASNGRFAAAFDGTNTTLMLVVPVSLTAGIDAPTLTVGDDTVTADIMDSLNAGDIIDGGDGSDTLVISAAQNITLGATTLTNVERITITGGAQVFTTDDSTVDTGQTLTVDASASTDTVNWNGSLETDGSFAITGSANNDWILGGGGNDTIAGGSDNDAVNSGAGNDLLHGDAGNDSLQGNDGNDTLYGGEGDDTLLGQGNDNLLYGEAGNDLLIGGDDADTLYGGEGNDIFAGGSGADLLQGEEGNDRLLGQDGDDIIDGGAGSDTLSGDAGNDTLHGGDGNDTLNGHAGNDLLYGEAGDDLFQGSASDLHGDTIADFDMGDSILVTGADLSSLNGTSASSTLDLGGGHTLTLSGITAASNFKTVFNGGNTTITLTAPPPAPPSEPETSDVDGVPVQTSVTDDGNQTITIPVVPASREDDPGTPLATHADVSIARGANGQDVLTLGVPVGTGVTTQGPVGIVTNVGARNPLLQGIASVTTESSTTRNTLSADANAFLDSLPAGSTVTVRTITPTSNSSTPSTDPLIIRGTGATEAVVIDVSKLPSGTTLQLDDIDFAVVVGAVRVVGGAGENQVVGDGSAQYIVLGADDDTLHGGGGNDTIGSLGGNDQAFGDDGNDVLFGGAGHDTLDGGNGDDALNGGFGIDVAQFAGARADYTVFGMNSGVVVTHSASGATDRLTDIEQLQFANGDRLFVAHNDIEAVAHHLMNTWLGRALTVDEAVKVQNITQASPDDIVQLFKALFATDEQKAMSTDELLAGLADDASIIRIAQPRKHMVGGDGDDTAYAPLGLGVTIDGGAGHDVLRLAGGRDDYHLETNGNALDITRLSDGAMVNLRNAEMIRFDDGDATVLAHDAGEALLGRLVQVFFDRGASVDEWALGRSALAAGVDRDSILSWFEDRAGLQQLDDTAYVQALYQHGLGRQATADELQQQLAKLEEPGFDRSELAIDVAQSSEAIVAIGNVMQIDGWV